MLLHRIYKNILDRSQLSKLRQDPMHFLKNVSVIVITVCSASACNYSTSTSSGSVSAASTASYVTGETEVTFSGETGSAELAGDKIRLTDGIVFINEISFGPVPAGVQVKYAINSQGRFLFVNGERRDALIAIK